MLDPATILAGAKGLSSLIAMVTKNIAVARESGDLSDAQLSEIDAEFESAKSDWNARMAEIRAKQPDTGG